MSGRMSGRQLWEEGEEAKRGEKWKGKKRKKGKRKSREMG